MKLRVQGEDDFVAGCDLMWKDKSEQSTTVKYVLQGGVQLVIAKYILQSGLQLLTVRNILQGGRRMHDYKLL